MNPMRRVISDWVMVEDQPSKDSNDGSQALEHVAVRQFMPRTDSIPSHDPSEYPSRRMFIRVEGTIGVV
jgi:hypothetical protein